MEKFDEDEKN